jgi:hypothetical protein
MAPDMTPSQWSNLHQWDAGCRLLMILHPGFGLRQAGIVRGTWESDLRPGWNRTLRDELAARREVYTFMGDKEGETTTVKPDVPANSIHDTRAGSPELHASEIWRTLVALGKKNADRRLLPSDRVKTTQQSIEYFARELRHRPLVHEWGMRAIGAMRKALAESRGGAIKAGDFFEPMFIIVNGYLEFALPGMLASELLALVLSAQCIFPTLGPPDRMPPLARRQAVEHLADVTYDLLTQRGNKTLSAYLKMTYLAGLYCRAAFILTNWAEESGNHSADDMKKLQNLRLNLDELFAHKIGPVFTLPALFRPAELLTWLRLRGQPDDDGTEFWQIHPPLRALLNSPKIADATKPKLVEKTYKAASDQAEDFDLTSTLRTTVSPVAPKNLKTIHMGILAVSVGQASLPR